MTQTIGAAARRLQDSMDRLEAALRQGLTKAQGERVDVDALRDALSSVTRAEATVRRMLHGDGAD